MTEFSSGFFGGEGGGVSLPISSDDVTNDSTTVTGATVSEALDALQAAVGGGGGGADSAGRLGTISLYGYGPNDNLVLDDTINNDIGKIAYVSFRDASDDGLIDDITIGGITGPAATGTNLITLLSLLNDTGSAIYLAHNSAGSASGNKLFSSSGLPVVIPPGKSILLSREGDGSNWSILDKLDRSWSHQGVVSGADNTTSSATFTGTFSGLNQMVLLPNNTYRVTARLLVQADATTTGVRVGLNATGNGLSSVCFQTSQPTTTPTTMLIGSVNAVDTSTGAVATPAADTTFMLTLDGVVTAADSGGAYGYAGLEIVFASSVGGSTVRIMAGSTVEVALLTRTI